MQSQAAGEFVRYPGQGYLFFKLAQPDVKTKAEQKAFGEKKTVPMVTVWAGWLVLPGHHEVQVRAMGSQRSKKYQLEIREFGNTEQNEDSWKKLTEFSVPAFGDQPYVDGEFTVGKRTYKLRMIKTDAGYIRLRLPQVANVAAAQKAMV